MVLGMTRTHFSVMFAYGGLFWEGFWKYHGFGGGIEDCKIIT